mmetsp:Transcript_138285/g.359373  ORF Transcript_138285/g.359373 Transcript_138285/m.359373 type:complete len:115 (+) Transcript_138285:831-1175(+)
MKMMRAKMTKMILKRTSTPMGLTVQWTMRRTRTIPSGLDCLPGHWQLSSNPWLAQHSARVEFPTLCLLIVGQFRLLTSSMSLWSTLLERSMHSAHGEQNRVALRDLHHDGRVTS